MLRLATFVMRERNLSRGEILKTSFLLFPYVFLLLTVARGLKTQPVQANDCPGVRGIVTAYQPFAPDGIKAGQCQYPCNITASGAKVDLGTTAACHKKYPFGTTFQVFSSNGSADGNSYVCTDRGGLKPNQVDIAVGNGDNPFAYTDHDACLVFTVRGRNNEIVLFVTPMATVNSVDSNLSSEVFYVTGIQSHTPTSADIAVHTTKVKFTQTPVPATVVYEQVEEQEKPDFIYNPPSTLPPGVDFVVGR